MSDPVLSIRNLVVEIPTRSGVLRPVDGISLDIGSREILGVVGESGAGKSMCGSAINRLIDPPGHIAGGEIYLNGKRIDDLGDEEIRRLRGRHIGMVFQDPITSLNPLMTVGDQITETIRTHLKVSAADARARALDLLNDVGIPAASSRIDNYPHQFSGGMRQRVVIALALAAEPGLIIADEPTTALDVSVQAQIMALLKKLCRERGTAVMLITHDMGVIAETTDRVAVLYAGRLIEIGTTVDVLSRPAHPYTRGLMASTPRTTGRADRLSQIPGSMPGLRAIPSGCAFHPRCDSVMPACHKHRPELTPYGDSAAACLLYSSSSENTP
ncbi:MAG: ABC transporter ATP-binding protein [Rhodospirillales bacterium]